MKCSLLSLSSYLDDELEGGKRGELEAHLVGCQRCSSGLGHLREEVGRISGLAPVHVPDDSARSLMEQLGLLVPGEPLPPRMAPRAASGAPDRSLPWLQGEAGKALPWRAPKGPLAGGPTPSLPVPQPPAPSISLQGRPADSRLFDTAQLTASAQSPAIPVPNIPAPVIPPATVEEQPPVPAPMARPSAVNVTPVGQSRHEPLTVPPAPEPLASELATPEVAATPPQPQPRAQVPFAAPVPAPVIPPRPQARPEPSPPRPAMPGPDSRLSGMSSGPGVPSGLELDSRSDLSEPLTPVRPSPVARLKERWAVQRALARTSSRMDDSPDMVPDTSSGQWQGLHRETPMPASEPQPGTRPMPVTGRHSLPLMARHGRSAEPAARPPQITALDRVRDVVEAASRNRPLVAFVASLLVLVVLVLTFGRSASPIAPKARTPSTSAQSSAPVIPVVPPGGSAVAPPGTTAVQLNDVKSLGTGATGMEVKDIRYGNHPGSFYRIVFDIVPGAAAQAGTPKATVGFKDPTTLWVILDGVAPAATAGHPVDGSTIASATQVDPAPAGKTIYEFKLAHPATVSSDYLPSPLRLVLDLK